MPLKRLSLWLLNLYGMFTVSRALTKNLVIDMPYQPLRRCSYPNCKNKVKSGRCEEHKPKDTRASSSARGYDHKWSKYRAQYLRFHPLCVMCLEKGIYTPATVIDHIKPVENGQADPLFWVESNHQALCRNCHSYKTRVIDQRGYGAKKEWLDGWG